MTSINVKAGESLLWTCVYKDDAATAVDLTGVTVACTAQHTVTGDRQTITPTVTSATGGQFQLAVAAATTATMALGQWKTDLSFTWADTSKTISTIFRFNIVETVTDGS